MSFSVPHNAHLCIHREDIELSPASMSALIGFACLILFGPREVRDASGIVEKVKRDVSDCSRKC